MAIMGVRNTLWAVMSLLLGVLLGVGVFTLQYANFTAYFGHDPATCAQCHAMQPYYDAWTKGSHHTVAGCSDCHTPHDSVIDYYIAEADNGFWHSLKFTTGNYPDNIQIRDVNLRITEEACLSCHGDMTDTLHQSVPAGETVSCTRCHPTVGHLE